MKNKIIIFIACILVGASAVLGTYKIIKDKEKKEDPKTEQKQPVVTSSGNYNVDLIKTVNNTQKDNYLISPYSIEIALQMLRDGAKEETKAQIDNLIGDRNIPTFTAKDRISVANAIFIKDKFKEYIEDSYYTKLKGYKAELVYDPFVSPSKINEWVNEKTYGMIPSILDTMDPYFVLGIANAVAIDVEWQYQFECQNTRSKEFTKTDGSKMNVEMMYQEYGMGGKTKYFETDNAVGVVIPYKSYTVDGESTYEQTEAVTTLEFVAVLPNGKVNDYINNLTEKELDIDSHIVDIKEDFIALSLPRFAYDFDLKTFKDVLVDLGIKNVFDPEGADLTGMISRENLEKTNTGNLYVGEAIHKTYIDLNEKGTKAAAVTYFGVYENTAIGDEPEYTYKYINFDKPFVYMIRDSKTKEILFFGVVETPNEWKGSTCSEREE